MGTALTGLEIKDTYDALVKITDNGPLSGTLKALSDGLGNDSTLSLSTAAASIAGTLAVTGATTLSSSLTSNGLIKSTIAGAGFRHFYNNGAASIEVSQRSDSKLQLYAYTGSAYTDILLGVDGSTVGGNVGIGTTAPASYGAGYTTLAINGSTDGAVIDLLVNGARRGSIYNSNSGNTLVVDSPTGTKIGFFVNAGDRAAITQNGITFNGDTAAANALDDYEEGTWTMGVAFGGASVALTTSSNTGTYTKIGRQVTVNGLILLTSKGSSTGSATITGLPFSIANNNANYSVLSLRIDKITFANQFQAYGDIGTTSISLEEITILGVRTALTDADFANDSSIIVSFTYFV